MSLKKNLVANYVGQGWAALMGLAFLPTYINYLGVEAYGLIGIFAMLQVWLNLFDIGMTPTLNREVARYTAGVYSAEAIRDLVRTFEIICCAIAVMIICILLVTSKWIATDWLNVKALPVAVVAQALSLMGVIAAFNFIEALYRGGLLGFQKHVWLNAVTAALATVRSVGAVIVLAFWSPTIQAFFIWQAAISVIGVALLFWGLRRNLPPIERPPHFSLGAFSEAWTFAGGMFVTTILALLVMQIDKVMLSRLLSLEDFGTYMFAVTVSGGISILVGPIAQSYYPRLSELVARGDESAVSAAYHQGAQLMSIMIVPAAFVMAAFSNPLLRIWSGNETLAAAAAPLVSVLALGTMLNGLMHIPYMLQLANGWSYFAARVNVVAVAILVPVLLIVVPRFGPIGAAWVWCAVNAGYILFSLHFMHTRLLPGHKKVWYLRDTLFPSVAAGGVTLLAAFMHPLTLGVPAEILWIALSSGAAFAAAVLASSQFRHYLVRFAS